MDDERAETTSVAQLPICACRDECQFPELPRATGHHCPGCKLAIHALCGVHDDKAGLDDSNWCYQCWNSKSQNQKRPLKTVAQHQPRKKRASSRKKPLLMKCWKRQLATTNARHNVHVRQTQTLVHPHMQSS
jgi:hypothetical protein